MSLLLNGKKTFGEIGNLVHNPGFAINFPDDLGQILLLKKLKRQFKY
jgi:hypothetical protein